jgi:hypothetical protein
MEDFLRLFVQSAALRLVGTVLSLHHRFVELLVAPAGAVGPNLYRITSPAQHKDLAVVSVVVTPAEHHHVMLAFPRTLQILAPFIGNDLHVDPDLGEVRLHHLRDCLAVGHVGPLDRACATDEI